jgi:hypothetical protein
MALRAGGKLLAAGEASAAIHARIEIGRYVRLYEGVYAIGHADLTVPAPEGDRARVR